MHNIILLMIGGAVNLIRLSGFKSLSRLEGCTAVLWALEIKLHVFLTSVLYEGEELANLDRLDQCFSTFLRSRPGKLFFYKTRARFQHIYS